MDLHIASHRWERRLPDWPAAATSGFLAGAVLMVLELLWMAASSAGPWATSHMIAGIVMGPEVLQSTAFSVPVVIAALVTHYILGIAFGMILAAIIAPFHLDSSAGMVLLSGAIFGLVLYLFNFYGMERAFPWFAAMRGWSTLVAHLIFGMVAAAIYWKMERPEVER
ncbi:MAG: hypothetical protein WA924_00420 [Burkholderiaceae bacterium]